MQTMLMTVATGRSAGALHKGDFSTAGIRVLALLLVLNLPAVAQVITLTNKAVTFTTLEGSVYRGVNLLKADLYGITWHKNAGGGRVAYTNLAAETLDSWGVPSNYLGRLMARETLRRNAPRPADPALQKAEEDNVREVAFKTLIYEAAATQEGYKVYFLSWGTSWTNAAHVEFDPSDEFIGRFAGRTPPVKKVSQSRQGERGEVLDKSTGQRGVIFTVTDLKWVSDKEVDATCSVHKAGLNGYTYKYKLSREKNQWKVANKELVSIS
jgi:hypothetical protein